MLEDMPGDEVIELFVVERPREDLDVVDDIHPVEFSFVHADGIGPLRRPAADIESLHGIATWNLSGVSFVATEIVPCLTLPGPRFVTMTWRMAPVWMTLATWKNLPSIFRHHMASFWIRCVLRPSASFFWAGPVWIVKYPIILMHRRSSS